MLICLPFHLGDVHLAKQLFEWISDLDRPMPQHELLLIASSDLSVEQIQEVFLIAKKSFQRLTVIKQNGADPKKWPQGPNNSFKSAAEWVRQNNKGHWLFLETDQVPMVPGWLDKLDQDYRLKGFPFYGAIFSHPYRHLNGSMIFPSNIAKFNPHMLGASTMPFDLVKHQATLKHGYASDLMWRNLAIPQRNVPMSFPDLKSLALVPPGVILSHCCKDGTLIQRLRERRFPAPVKPKMVEKVKRMKKPPVLILDEMVKPEPKWWKKIRPFKKTKGKTILDRPMNLAILYICVHTPSEPEDPRDWNMCNRRFVETYLKYKPTIPHRVIIVNYNGERTPETDEIFAPLNPEHAYYVGQGFDIGTYQQVGRTIDADLVLFCGSQVHFHRSGWLERFAEAFKKHGEGMYGPMGSYERMPHLRTCCVALPPKLLRRYPHYIDSRADTYRAESGDWNLTAWVASQGKPTLMVTWDGELDVKDWRKPNNIFRRGDQSNCLIWDRHTKVYAEATPEYRKELERSAQGGVPGGGVHRFDIICKEAITPKKSVTIVAMTSLAPKSHAEAIRRTAACIPFECKKLLMSPVQVPRFDGEQLRLPEPWAKDGKWSMESMADFTLTGLHKIITTDVAIIVHWDGYALNRERWTNDFLDWDYIGAPWPQHMTFLRRQPNGRVNPLTRVGNGGFSLRSKKWLEAASKMPKLPFKYSEDVYAATIQFNHFIKAGCKIPPLGIAMRWSFEHHIEEFPAWQLSDSFGYHGLVDRDPLRAHLKLDKNT